MILHIVCIKDSALDAYERPFFVPSIGLAIRHFGDEINSTDSPMYKHPEDFFLFGMGEFETDTGLFDTAQPRQLSRGLDHVQKPMKE